MFLWFSCFLFSVKQNGQNGLVAIIKDNILRRFGIFSKTINSAKNDSKRHSIK